MTTNQTSSRPRTVICPGLFFVVSGDTAAAHILPPDEVTSFYAGTRFAFDSRDPETALQNLVQRTFRAKDATFAIGARDKATLVDIMDTYDGPAKDFVRGLAAHWVLGPFQDFDDDGGVRDRKPESPTPPPAPAGTEQPETSAEQCIPQSEPAAAFTLDSLLAMANA